MATFDDAAASAIVRAVETVQRRPVSQPAQGREFGGSSAPPLTWVRCTSGTADGDGNYPGVVVQFDSTTGAWSDYGVCKVRDPNGTALVSGTRYGCRLAGSNSDGVTLFMAVGKGTGSSGAGGNTIIVQDVDASPRYENTALLAFDSADGFSLSEIISGSIRVDMLPCGIGQTGVVTTSTQDLPGSKAVDQLYAGGTTAGFSGIDSDIDILCAVAAYLPFIGVDSDAIDDEIIGATSLTDVVPSIVWSPSSDLSKTASTIRMYGMFHRVDAVPDGSWVWAVELVNTDTDTTKRLIFSEDGIYIDAGFFQIGGNVGQTETQGFFTFTGGLFTALVGTQGDISYIDNTANVARLGIGTEGQVLTVSGGYPAWEDAPTGGGGTVTSVGLSLPAEFSVSGSPVTTSGTLSATWASAGANTVFAGPSGGGGTPAFRALVSADIPNIDAAKITTGTLAVARGGTNIGSYTTGDLLYASGATTLSKLAIGTGTQVLGVSGGVPAWVANGLDINGLTGADPALDDEVPIYDVGATANRKVTVQEVLGLARLDPGGRLSVTSDPTGTSFSSSTIYYVPFVHDLICLWDGTRWVWLTFSSTTLSLSGLTSGKNYDVFGYLSSGALALEHLVWTNDTTRATAVTYQDGRLCKSGDKTRLLLGTFRSISTTQTQMESAFGFLSNVYNRVPIDHQLAEITASWTQTSASWRQARSTSSNRIQYVETLPAGSLSAVDAMVCASGYLSSGAAIVAAAVGVDSTSTPSGLYGGPVTANGVTLYGTYRGRPGTGYHALNWLEYGSASTMNWYGWNTGIITGITATIWG